VCGVPFGNDSPERRVSVRIGAAGRRHQKRRLTITIYANLATPSTGSVVEQVFATRWRKRVKEALRKYKSEFLRCTNCDELRIVVQSIRSPVEVAPGVVALRQGCVMI